MIPRYDLVSEYLRSEGFDIYYMESAEDGDYIEAKDYKKMLEQLHESIKQRIDHIKNNENKTIRELYSDQSAVRELESLQNFIIEISKC